MMSEIASTKAKRAPHMPDQLDLAVQVARMAHGQQTDKLGFEYFAHVIHVMNLVEADGGDEATCIIALLHDTIEATALTIGTVDRLFGERVADGVVAMTKLPDEDYFEEYLPRLMTNRDAVRVKLADSRHNRGKCHLLAQHDRELAEKLDTEHQRVIETLTGGSEPALRFEFADGMWQ